MRFRQRPIDPIAEEQAFLEGVYSRMKTLLHKLILSQGATESEAEDILKEAFLRLWQKVETLIELPERKCFNYVYTTVSNTTLSHLSRKARQPVLPLEENVPAPAKGPEEYYLSLEKEQIFRRALEKLDDNSRQLLLLRYVLEEDDKQIAMRFGVRPESLRMMVSRARAKLKTEMRKLEDGGEGDKK